MKSLLPNDQRIYSPEKIQVKSGLMINVTADKWQLLPTTQKGWTVDVSWLWDIEFPEEDRLTILEVYAQYARTSAASTTATLITNTKSFLHSGIPDLPWIRLKWSGLPTHHKKSLNQFFGTLARLGQSEYKNYHAFTKAHLDKGRSNVFDSQKGSLNGEEYDSFCASLNLRLQSVEWGAERTLEFFQSADLFGRIRSAVTNKLLTMVVQRPIQLSALKWSDLAPAGSSYNDHRIDSSREVGSIGNNQLQLRCFYAKKTGKDNWRALPEQYPIALSESLSKTLIQYKRLFTYGIRLLLGRSALAVSQKELLDLVTNMPMFINADFFAINIANVHEISALFNDQSRAFHCSASAIATNLRYVSIESSRDQGCSATSNRIRHTILTRGAQHGLDAIELAKITGVTTPAARHYIDLDYESRLLIDGLYLGSSFLADIFSSPLEETPEDDQCVHDQLFDPVGGLRDKRSCTSCPTVMGRPVGCYGCNNFRPILEANHGRVLEYAESKLTANSSQISSPEEKLSLEKLKKQIHRIKLTINACEQLLRSRRGIE